ncbi:hypothetical protein C8J57DRAFT_1478354 [Mycena rebaudengoi]|nr:hypothetical protein C8J57DRAFT_1478354 [Mycena rebaudengoi]
MEKLHLDERAEDILYLIMCFCDVYTALSMSQTNSRYKRIAYAKNIWICLLRDLSARRLINLPHDLPLTDYSTAELIEEVKRVVLGPKTWSRSSHSSPLVSRECSIPRSPDIPFPSLRLLPGGRYLIVESSARIELWDAAISTLAWFHEDNPPLNTRHVGLLDGGSAIYLSMTSHLLTFIYIDLNTGHSADLYTVEPPSNIRFSHRPTVSGDFFMCQLAWQTWPYRYLVGNWRTETTAILTHDIPIELTLVAGHIFFSTADQSPPHLRLTAVSIREYLSHLQTARIPSINEVVSICDLAVVVTQEIPFPERPSRNYISIHKSPLRYDTYKLAIYLVGRTIRPAPTPFALHRVRQRLSMLFKGNTSRDPFPAPQCTIYKFRFSTSSTNKILDCKPTSSAPGSPFPYIYPFLISYAGYAGVEADGQIFNLHAPLDPRTGRQEGSILAHGLLASSGHAVTAVRDSSYVISYYV